MNTGLENLGPEAMPKVAGGFFQLWNERFRGSASVELRIYSCIFSTLDEFQNFSWVCCYQFQVFTLDLMFILVLKYLKKCLMPILRSISIHIRLANTQFEYSEQLDLMNIVISKRRSASPPGATAVEADYLEADLNDHAVEYFSDRLSTAEHFFIQMFHSRQKFFSHRDFEA